MAQRYIGITLPIRRGNTGMFAQSTTLVEQARSNLRNLLLTVKGERPMQPDFGCDLSRLVFDPMDSTISDRARATITDAVDRWLPYIEIQDVEVNEANASNQLRVSFTYRFRSNPNVYDSIEVITTAVE